MFSVMLLVLTHSDPIPFKITLSESCEDHHIPKESKTFGSHHPSLGVNKQEV